MAETTLATNNALTKKLYQEKLFRDVVKESYFSRFMGSTSSSMVQVKTELEKSQGDEMTFGLRMRLSGTGVEDDNILEGNEEDLTTYSNSIVLKQYRHAVKDNGALTRQRAVYDVDSESEMALKDWGNEKIDALCFDAILDTPTKVFYRASADGAVAAGSAAIAKAALSDANGKINTVLLSALSTWAKTGGNRTYVPIRPLVVDGKNYYVLLTHPDCMHDLRNDSTFQAAMRDAAERGKENPLFRGSFAIWNGVVIHEHENCTPATDGGGASVPWAKGCFLGAQSLLWAFGRRPRLIEKNFDYENKHGKAWGVIARAKKPVFNSLDFGSLGVYLARTNVSGL